MTTWATSTPFGYPWFRASSMKRKEPSTAEGYDVKLTPSPPPKRRRIHLLEDRLVHLSLTATTPLSGPISSVGTCNAIEASTRTTFQALANIPYTVPFSNLYPVISEVHVTEEMDILPSPSSAFVSHLIDETPEIPEVKMKTSTWYEPDPDRIVITDLDASSDDDEDGDGGSFDATDKPSLNIPSALIDKIRRNTIRFSQLPPPSESPSVSRALVLFRHAPRVTHGADFFAIEPRVEEPGVSKKEIEDDKMDIEE